MTRFLRLDWVNWRLVAAALLAIGILHISATLLAPQLATATAYQRLSSLLPLNVMKVLPPLTSATQPLPFLSADSRYAICRFSTAEGPVTVSATLWDRGWTIVLQTSEGESLYAAAGETGQRSDLSLLLVPSDERFLGLTPEARGIPQERAPLTLAARQGLVIVRAPDKGFAYAADIERRLKAATCGAHTSPSGAMPKPASAR